MKGSVSKYETAQGELWRWVWTEQLADGTAHQHSKRGFLRKRDAEIGLRASLKEYDQGKRTHPDLGLTVGVFLPLWLENKRASLEPSTWRSYKITVDRVLPGLGHLPLRKVEAADILRLLAVLRAPGANRRGKAQKPLAEGTISRTLVILGAALDQAVTEGKLNRNPVDDVDKPKKTAPVPVAWTATELRTFLQAREADRLYPLWYLAANTGMRRSELLGLRWHSVDLDAGVLSVVERRVMVSYEMHERPGGKTTGSVRRIDIDEETVAVLRRWQETQELEALVHGNPASGLVFSKKDGSGLHSDFVGDNWGRAVRESGIRPIPFKGLRSTHGTLLIKAGVPVKDVSERLGHASPAITMSVYQAVMPGSGRLAAQTFAAALRGSEDRAAQ